MHSAQLAAVPGPQGLPAIPPPCGAPAVCLAQQAGTQRVAQEKSFPERGWQTVAGLPLADCYLLYLFYTTLYLQSM